MLVGSSGAREPISKDENQSSRSSDEFLGDSDDDYTGLSSDLEDDLTWIEWFCAVKGNEFFVEVDEDYIRDDFNLTGLNEVISHYEKALDVILDVADDEEEEDDADGDESVSASQSSLMRAAQSLYGLIHARFILTHRGMVAMLEKYNAVVYGTCPNVYCNNQIVVPVSTYDIIGKSSAKVFCPRCNEMYHPTSTRLALLDGAFFGTTFAHMFFLQYDHLVPKTPPLYYVPKIYGFNVWKGVKDRLRAANCKALTSSSHSTEVTAGNPSRPAQQSPSRSSITATSKSKQSPASSSQQVIALESNNGAAGAGGVSDNSDNDLDEGQSGSHQQRSNDGSQNSSGGCMRSNAAASTVGGVMISGGEIIEPHGLRGSSKSKRVSQQTVAAGG